MFRNMNDGGVKRRGDLTFNLAVQIEAKNEFGDDYKKDNYSWEKTPSDTQCLKCNEWRRFPPGERHFGYGWFKTCDQDCKCGCHNEEIWS